MKPFLFVSLLMALSLPAFITNIPNQINDYIVVPVRNAVTIETADQLLVVSSEHCPPCERLKPVLEQLKKEGYDVTTVLIQDYIGPEHIKGTPTLLYFYKGGIVRTELGYQTYRTITRTLKKAEKDS